MQNLNKQSLNQNAQNPCECLERDLGELKCELNDSKRREFLTKGAKLSAGIAFFGSGILASNANAQNAKTATNASAQSNADVSIMPNTEQSHNLRDTLSAKNAKIPAFKLNNGVIMPAVGFGTLKLGDSKQTQKAVEDALEAGYRLFDTAQSYANEEAVGYALKATGIKRAELFITCKLFRPYANEALAGKAYFESLKKLQIDYADLYLIHQPVNDTYGAWRAMSKLYKDKAVRAIGVSNFNPARIMDFVQNNEITPAVNQIECHPHFQQEVASQNLKELGIQMQAFSPLKQARDNILNDKTLTKIAQAHKKSVAQVILRWVYQRGIISIAKSTSQTRMRENLAIFDFSLSAGEMAQIAKLETGKPLLDHQDPARIKWFNERTAGENLK